MHDLASHRCWASKVLRLGHFEAMVSISNTCQIHSTYGYEVGAKLPLSPFQTVSILLSLRLHKLFGILKAVFFDVWMLDQYEA